MTFQINRFDHFGLLKAANKGLKNSKSKLTILLIDRFVQDAFDPISDLRHGISEIQAIGYDKLHKNSCSKASRFG